jgi:hypothetical protein
MQRRAVVAILRTGEFVNVQYISCFVGVMTMTSEDVSFCTPTP